MIPTLQQTVDRFKQIISDITAERGRQDAKWGVQDHSFAHYNAILIEEVGEVSKAYLEGNTAELRAELVQTAAVVVAMLETLDRNPTQFVERAGERAAITPAIDVVSRVNRRQGQRRVSPERRIQQAWDGMTRAAQGMRDGQRRKGVDRRKG